MRELSAGLRIKTRGEFESGKVLNDFRRSCLASWFIRKSQFAQREREPGGRRVGEGGEREKGWEKGRLCTAVGVCTWRKVVELKLRRCLSPFVPNLRSLEGIEGRRRFSPPSPTLPSSLAALGIRDKSCTVVHRSFQRSDAWFLENARSGGRRRRFSSQLVSYLTTSIERRAHLPTGGGGGRCVGSVNNQIPEKVVGNRRFPPLCPKLDFLLAGEESRRVNLTHHFGPIPAVNVNATRRDPRMIHERVNWGGKKKKERKREKKKKKKKKGGSGN